jgi:hypothetical protein
MWASRPAFGNGFLQTAGTDQPARQRVSRRDAPGEAARIRIPLQQATIENGCMWFIPGSHPSKICRTTASGMTCERSDDGRVKDGEWTADRSPLTGEGEGYATASPTCSGPDQLDQPDQNTRDDAFVAGALTFAAPNPRATAFFALA